MEQTTKKYKFIDEGGKHIHTFGGEPLMGTSSILKEVYPPMLAWWAARLALEPLGRLHDKDDEKKPVDGEKRLQKAGAFLKEIASMDESQYLALLDAAYRAHDDEKKKQGKAGTKAHGHVEDYIRRCLAENGGKPLPADSEVKQFAEWAIQEVNKFAFTEAHVYSEALWVGGIVDYAYWDKSDRFIIGDRKTSKDIYPTHFYQTAGYGIQFEENGAFTPDGEKIMEPEAVLGYSIFQQKGDSEARVLERDDFSFLERIFRHSVDVYKDKKNIGSVIVEKK